MKTEYTEVNETQKRLAIEIPADVVDAEIASVTVSIGRRVKIPGFRPGKVPAGVVWQRFKDDILHEVAQELVPAALGEILRERDLDPVATPDVTEVVVNAGQPLTFTATFDTLPVFDPGDYRGIPLRKKPAVVEDAAVDEALERLRQRGARFEPIEGRSLGATDWATVDLERRTLGANAKPEPDKHNGVTIEMGAAANPPGFSDALVGLEAGETRSFTVTYPADYEATELAGTQVEYIVTLKAIKQRVVPALDDDFAKDLGNFDTLDALRERVRHDLQHEANDEADHALRTELLANLSARVAFTLPDALVDQELTRRLEDFARRLADQKIDPSKAGIDWKAFADGQRDSAVNAVKATVVLDEIARKEPVVVTDEDVDREIQRYAEASGRTVESVRAHLEKEDGLGRLRGGMRREKTIEFLLANASITTA